MTAVGLPLVWAAAPLAFAVAVWLTGRFADPRSRLHLLDHPNERSLHTRPTPRSGGLAILGGITAGLAAALSSQGSLLAWLAIIIFPLAIVSFLDDRFGVSVRWRLLVHFLAAGVIILAGFGLQSLRIPGMVWECPAWTCAVVTTGFVLWMINLYNFMDGMDGFAGGMAVFGFGAFALMGWLAGHEQLFIMNLIIAAAAGGFLLFNFPPAKIFMGDTGSSTLGFLAAGMSLWGAKEGVFTLWVAMLIFSPFIVDATVTLIRRIFRGERFWLAHKTHYYQRLVQAGWGHRKTVLLEYAIMVFCAGVALLVYRSTPLMQWVAIGAIALLYAALFRWIGVLEQESTRRIEVSK